MKNSELRITRWLDGELSDDDVRDLLEAQPELLEEKRSFQQMSDLLKQEMTFEGDVESPDFFNHQVLRKIEAEEEQPARSEFSGFGDWLNIFQWSPQFAGATACAALAAIFAIGSMQNNNRLKTEMASMENEIAELKGTTDASGPGPMDTEVYLTYMPNSEEDAEADFNGDAGATVIDLPGLDAIPATEMILGHFPSRSEHDPMVASTTFYSADDKPILVLTENLAGEPTIHKIPSL